MTFGKCLLRRRRVQRAEGPLTRLRTKKAPNDLADASRGHESRKLTVEQRQVHPSLELGGPIRLDETGYCGSLESLGEGSVSQQSYGSVFLS